MPRIPEKYNPRPFHLRETSITALDKLGTDLLSLSQPCALLEVLLARVESALHDHNYANMNGDAAEKTTFNLGRQPCPYTADEMMKRCKLALNELHVTREERRTIEQLTTCQSKGAF